MSAGRNIKVLVVDDSALARKALTEVLAAESDLEVVGTAPDPYVARDKILRLEPDVVTLDIEMPRMDGLTFLKKLMHYRPMPVIIISSLGQASCQAALEALGSGAVEVVAKPGDPNSMAELAQSLPAKIRAAAAARIHPRRQRAPAADAGREPLTASPVNSARVIVIGASTGGVEAVERVLTQLPGNVPGIVITQHMPAGFSRAFAERLNGLCRMEVAEARDGDWLPPGRALVAPGGLHTLVRKAGGQYHVTVKDGPLVCYQRPSVDVLFRSVAEAAGDAAIGVLLTGMGSDGAQGMLKMRQAGAYTIAQDEASCVVYGMPREAIKLDAAARVAPLEHIPAAICMALESHGGC